MISARIGVEKSCRKNQDMVYFGNGTIVYYKGVDLPSYIRWEVVRMKFDFKDLMAFGMFILALLTFIVMISQ